MFENKTILLTGGTGSFGRAFTTHVTTCDPPKKLIIFSRDELKQAQMRAVFGDKGIRYFIGDVRDRDRLRRAMEGVDVVIHAAAMKRIEFCEYNPLEAIATNVLGAENVMLAAIGQGVEKVVALSSDKACAPVNLYGCTKACLEHVFRTASVLVGDKGGPLFCCVRYGNVIGSRGSVVRIWERQVEEELPITVTDRRMTRFWLTMGQAIMLVQYALNSTIGGEIFIPRPPAMKILDLARIVAPDVKVMEIGLFPGEKLHEALLSEDEVEQAVLVKDMMILLPYYEINPATYNYWSKKGTKVQAKYSSANPDRWLTDEEMEGLV